MTWTASSVREMRLDRNRLRVLWRRDPREPGRTIIWSPPMRLPVEHGRHGTVSSLTSSTAIFRRSPMAAGGYGRACQRGLISDDDLTARLARLRSRIMEADHALDRSR